MQEQDATGPGFADAREQVLDRTRFTIEASGLPDGWVRGTATPWDPQTAEFYASPCSTGEGGSGAGRIELTLDHDPLPDDDAEAVVRAVWDAWEGEGYDVSWVVGPGDVDVEHVDLSLRVDGADGLVAVFGATEHLVSMDVMSDCSTRPDMDPRPGRSG